MSERRNVRDNNIFEPLGEGDGEVGNRSIASRVDHNYILVSINGTNSPFPTTLQIFRSKAMIRPSFVFTEGRLKCERTVASDGQIGKCLNILYRQSHVAASFVSVE
jgi:hypothetical protein